MRRPPQPPAPPLITRRTTLAVGAVCLAAAVTSPLLFAASGRGAGAVGAAAALDLAVGMVSCLVVWVSGAVLAMRRHSFLWLVVALMFPPFGSLACALLMDVSPTPTRRR
jgi:hypothetical protein